MINYSLCKGQIIILRKATWRRGRLTFMRRDVSLQTVYIRGKTSPNLPHLMSQDTHSHTTDWSGLQRPLWPPIG